MKITIEHQAYIKQATEATGNNTVENLKKYNDAGLSLQRFCWDLLWSAKLSPWICNNIYPYANDEHIDTLLRQIVKPTVEELKELLTRESQNP
jgi:hypothetical protein